MSHRLILSRSNPYEFALLEWRAAWLNTARPEQLAPRGDWKIWAILSGRGWGKTRTGAEQTLYSAASAADTRWAVVAPTNNDCRRVCFEGESGLVESLPKYFRDRMKYNRAELELRLPNDSLISGYSAEKPDRLRGPQHHGAWCDEVASWGATVSGGKAAEGPRLKETWSNLDLGLRKGNHPRIVVTTTPRPIRFIRELVKNPRSHVTTGSTFDNSANLAESALETYREVYEGTRLGQQELYGQILTENENALWKASQFEEPGFRTVDYPDFKRIVIAVDPAVTSADSSDETGIIAAGLGTDGLVYVLEDVSGHYSPRDWALAALRIYERYQADCIVGETNQGGDLVEANLRAEAEGRLFKFKGVHAKRGKFLRAEPVAGFYQKGRVRHVGRFFKLEEQMCEFTGSSAFESPDRLDALVYAVTELLLGTKAHVFY